MYEAFVLEQFEYMNFQTVVIEGRWTVWNPVTKPILHNKESSRYHYNNM